MFQFALRKMRQNRWLAASLLAGYLMAVAIVCSMPVYSHAILSRMLLKDLEQVQTEQNVYPGRILAETDLYRGDNRAQNEEVFQTYDSQFHTLLEETRLPLETSSLFLSANNLRIAREGTAQEDIRKNSETGALGACTGLFDNVELLDGSIPSASMTDGVIEAAVSEEAAYRLGCSMGSVYELYEYD